MTTHTLDINFRHEPKNLKAKNPKKFHWTIYQKDFALQTGFTSFDEAKAYYLENKEVLEYWANSTVASVANTPAKVVILDLNGEKV